MTDSVTGSAALPVIFSNDAMAYGTFTIARTDHLCPQLVALDDPPPLTAWSVDLLESADHRYVTFDGSAIRVTLDNGSWIWKAEAQSPDGRVLYGRWPD